MNADALCPIEGLVASFGVHLLHFIYYGAVLVIAIINSIVCTE